MVTAVTMQTFFKTTVFPFLWIGCGYGFEALQWDFGHDHDLTSFITRPEIKAPLFDVAIYEPDKVSPGYWFVAPYWQIGPESFSQKFQPCQVGPHIYDADGVSFPPPLPLSFRWLCSTTIMLDSNRYHIFLSDRPSSGVGLVNLVM